MKPYGKTKCGHSVEGHQECGICHPPQKNLKKRARRNAKKDIANENLERILKTFQLELDNET